jgi:hypothetical protein
MLRLAEPLAGFARIKAGSPQITGIVVRYRKTILDAFHRISFREKIHATIGEQRKDLDVWTKGKQSRVGGDPRSAKLDHAPAAGIAPENLAVRCPRRVRHGRLD